MTAQKRTERAQRDLIKERKASWIACCVMSVKNGRKICPIIDF
jgi:hypothetical protein